ncbi:MAG: DUF3842 family protein [Bacillota bacterium]
MKVAVVDGQGGGIGRTIIEKLVKHNLPEVEIIALGTNAIATSSMLKAGAHRGATGENAIWRNANEVDLIVGCIGIVVANSMMGELTPKMAEAIATSRAHKLLLPVPKCGIEVVGVSDEHLLQLIDTLVERVVSIAKQAQD